MPALPSYLSAEHLHDFISRALIEDIGPGDYSSLAAFDRDTRGHATLVIKEEGVLAGVDVAREVFNQVDDSLVIDFKLPDGQAVSPGDIVLEVSGVAQSILSSERLVLNFMQRMSGIATKASQMCKKLEGTPTQLLDTRKTTPNFRAFEKWAVQIGGGVNHRFALHDMIMLKDNHNDYAGSIGKAVARAKQYVAEHNLHLDIEVETRSLDEVRDALEAGADIIMLDNMDTATMKEAVTLIGGTCKSEASGGITERNITEIAATGVDFISVGALTHSYKSLDMSLKASLA